MKKKTAGGLGRSQNLDDPQGELRESAVVVSGRGQGETGRTGGRAGEN